MKKDLRNILLIILFIVLTLILIMIFRGHLPFGGSNSSFAVDNDREITRIEFSEGGKKLKLEKKENEWFVNGKETRKGSILFILRVLQEIKIKSPVSVEKFNTDIPEKNNPLKVKVYGNSRLLKSFLVYKTNTNDYGNIMKLREKSKPFIMYIPGYEMNIGSAFVMNELYWQPFNVFNFLPSEIVTVTMENFRDTLSSFRIVNRNSKIFLFNNSSELYGFDISLAKRYLTYFTWIPFESWAFDLSDDEQKFIQSRTPLFRITIESINGKKSSLTLWEKEKTENGRITADSDRLWGKTEENSGLIIMRYFDVDPILKKRSYFFPE